MNDSFFWSHLPTVRRGGGLKVTGNLRVASVRVLLLTSKSQGRQTPVSIVLHTARDIEVFLQRLLFPPRAAKTVPIELFLQPL